MNDMKRCSKPGNRPRPRANGPEKHKGLHGNVGKSDQHPPPTPARADRNDRRRADGRARTTGQRAGNRSRQNAGKSRHDQHRGNTDTTADRTRGETPRHRGRQPARRPVQLGPHRGAAQGEDPVGRAGANTGRRPTRQPGETPTAGRMPEAPHLRGRSGTQARHRETASRGPLAEPPYRLLDRLGIDTKVPRDVREGGAARPHGQDIGRDRLVDWGRDGIPKTSVERKGREGSTPLRLRPPPASALRAPCRVQPPLRPGNQVRVEDRGQTRSDVSEQWPVRPRSSRHR